ncbi:glycosyltransferase [Halostella sp. JP-L12]|uniref:glycosyltransferase n=1 Tax=Halostella TaxID=1843185 RepID=UPI000EF76A9F|nr:MULTISPECIES: glycosyltransferase [Halostella]NHN46544.1 glycosyltransferase [Halostella sp. JP-L12]
MSNREHRSSQRTSPASPQLHSSDDRFTSVPGVGRANELSDEPNTVQQPPFLSVVLPAYNEARSIKSTLSTVDTFAAKVCEDYEIIVIDDGSDDATREAVYEVMDDVPSVRIVRNDENHGKGHAVRDGCLTATGRYVLFMDADGDLMPKRTAAFVERAEVTGADVVIGSKRHPESDVSYPLKRRVLSTGYSALIRALFGLHVTDTQVGMKLLTREAVDDVMPLLREERYAFDVELLALLHRRGYTIAEAPVSLDFDGDSSIDWSEVCRIGLDTLAVFCRLKRRQFSEKLDHGISYVQRRVPTYREGHR